MLFCILYLIISRVTRWSYWLVTQNYYKLSVLRWKVITIKLFPLNKSIIKKYSVKHKGVSRMNVTHETLKWGDKFQNPINYDNIELCLTQWFPNSGSLTFFFFFGRSQKNKHFDIIFFHYSFASILYNLIFTKQKRKWIANSNH